MRAGLMRDTLSFYELTTTQSSSGAKKKEYVKKLSAKAHKLTVKVDGSGVDAKENFLGEIVTFELRKDTRINKNQQVEWMSNKYSVQLIEYRQSDNAYILTIKRVNE